MYALQDTFDKRREENKRQRKKAFDLCPFVELNHRVWRKRPLLKANRNTGHIARCLE